MELTRDFERGITERIAADPAFASAVLDEIDELLLAGDDATARGMLRALVMGTIGVDALARPLDTASESLHQILSTDVAFPSPGLSAIVSALKRELGVAAS
ncbi:transcriptional regulator [Rugamonas sp. A1-17]|nr:transcriptional regulator [Rugamonas sp. A1-17]